VHVSRGVGAVVMTEGSRPRDCAPAHKAARDGVMDAWPLATSCSGGPFVPDSRQWRSLSFVATLVLRTGSPTNEEDQARQRAVAYPKEGPSTIPLRAPRSSQLKRFPDARPSLPT
jgi:hypothetical protein